MGSVRATKIQLNSFEILYEITSVLVCYAKFGKNTNDQVTDIPNSVDSVRKTSNDLP